WLVPGMREELVTELIRSLPKPIRRHLVPAPERAKAVAATLHDDDPDTGEPFLEAVADELVALPGVPEDLPLYGPEFDIAKLPAHLRMHFRVVDDRGRQIGAGDDLEQLKDRLKKRVDATVSTRADDLAQKDLPGFPAQGVPPVHESTVGGLKVPGYPALVARRGEDGRLQRVDLAVLATADEQSLAHREGVIALLDRDLGADLGAVLNALPNPTKLAVAGSGYASTAALLADASRAATVHLAGTAEVRTAAEYEALLAQARSSTRSPPARPRCPCSPSSRRSASTRTRCWGTGSSPAPASRTSPICAATSRPTRSAWTSCPPIRAATNGSPGRSGTSRSTGRRSGRSSPPAVARIPTCARSTGCSRSSG